MSLSVTRALDEVAARLSGVPGWPASVHRNRGRLTLWQDVAASDVVAGVNDGDPRTVLELIDVGPRLEFDQAATIELLVRQPDDAVREAALSTARLALLDALTPRPGPGQPRDRTLGGLVGDLSIEAVEADNLAVDQIAGVAGFRVRLQLGLTGDTLFGEMLGGAQVEAGLEAATLEATGALLIRGAAVLDTVPASMAADASLAPIELTAAITAAPAVMAAAGQIGISAAVAMIAAPAVVTATATNIAQGSGNITASAEPVSLIASGVSAYHGTAALQAAPAALTADAVLGVAGSAALITAPAVSITEAALFISASASMITAPAGLVASASLPITGSAALVAGTASLAATIVAQNRGDLVIAAAPASLTASGVGQIEVTGAAAMITAPAILAATGQLLGQGASALVAAPAAITATGVLAIAGDSAAAAAPAVMTQAGSLDISGAAAMIAAPAGIVTEGAVRLQGAASLQAAPAATAASGALAVAASAAAAAAPATLTGDGTIAASGFTYPASVLHAWDPDAGAVSDIIADKVGSANMWARRGGGGFPGEFTGELDVDRAALVIDEGDVPGFTALSEGAFTFWALMRSNTDPFCWFAAHADDSLQSGSTTNGAWEVRRNDQNADFIYRVVDSGAVVGANTGIYTGAFDVWGLYVVNIGAAKWRATKDAIASEVDHTALTAPGPTAIGRAFMLGARGGPFTHTSNVDSGRWYKGRFGDVRMWDHALTTQEITDLFNAGRQSPA